MFGLPRLLTSLATIGLAAHLLPAASDAPDLLERALALDEAPAAERDAARVAVAYREAAERGDAFALQRLGYLYETGQGLPQDYGQARACYEAAVAAGVQEAALRLAICHLEGWGGAVDTGAFVREVRRAAEAGYLPAQRVLAGILMMGFHTPLNVAEGVRWLERAAHAEDADAQHQLGRHAERLRILMSQADRSLARHWYELSAEQDYTAAMLAMARSLLSGRRESRDWATAHRWLELAHEQGSAAAAFHLALVEMLHPDSPQRDVEKARAWLQEASARGQGEATEVLEMEKAGKSLMEAMWFVLNTPYDERYVQLQAAAPVDPTARKVPPQVQRVVRPIYPHSLRITGDEGQAMIEFVVEVTGRVKDVRVVSAAHPLFGERAAEAVRQWRFTPGRVDGRLVNTRMQVPLIFQIREEGANGVEGLLSQARDLAFQQGVDIGAAELGLAVPSSLLPEPRLPEGKVLVEGAQGLLLLWLDENGRVQRAQVLHALPEALGPALLEMAQQHRFRPRVLDGQPTPSNAVLFYRKPPDAPRGP